MRDLVCFESSAFQLLLSEELELDGEFLLSEGRVTSRSLSWKLIPDL
jgi:hypothetical protein